MPTSHELSRPTDGLRLGQTVHLTHPVHHRHEGLVPGKITKIGSQYLHVKTHRMLRFDRDTGREVDAALTPQQLGRLYPDPQVYHDAARLEANKLRILEELPARIPMLSLAQSDALIQLLDDVKHQRTTS